MIKKIIKYSVYFLILFLIIISGLLIFINTEWGRGSIVGIVNKYSPVRIELNGLRLNIFTGKLLLEDLSIYDKENIKMGGIRQLIADIQYKPMLSGIYVIDSLYIGGLYGEINTDQINSFRKKDKKEQNKKPLDLIIKQIVIAHTDLKYKDNVRSIEYGFKNNKITASVNLKDADYNLRLDGSEIKINSFEINKTIASDSLIVKLKKSRLDIEPANLKTEGLDLSLGGTIQDVFKLTGFDVKFSAGVETSLLMDKSETFVNDQGHTSISGKIMGDLDNPELDISIAHPSGIIYGQEIGSLDIQAYLKDKLLTVESKLIKGKDETIDIDALFDLSSVFAKGIISSKPEFDKIIYDLMISSDNFSLQNVPDMPDIKLDLDLDIKGRGIKPKDITASIIINTKLTPFAFREFKLMKSADLKADLSWNKGKLDSKINFSSDSLEWKDYKLSGIDLLCMINEEGLIEIKKCDLRLDSATISLNGNSTFFDKDWHILKDPEINVSLTGKNILTKEFYPAVDTKLNFSMNTKGNLRSLKGKFVLNTSEISYSGVKIENVSVKGEFSGREVILDSLNIACGGSNITAHAKITDLNKFESRIRTEKLKIELLYPKIQNTFKGAVSFDITAGGDFKNPVVNGDIELHDSYVREKRLSDMKVNLSLKDLLADLKIDLGFDVSAKLNLKDSNYSFKVDFNKWDYTFLIPDSTDRKRNGFINGTIAGNGNFKSLQEYNIKADLDSVILNIEGRKIISGNKLSAVFTKGVLKLDKFRLNLLNEGFIQAGGNVSPEKKLDFSIQVNLPIESLGFIHPDLYESEGYLKGDIDIKGILTEPELSGKINLEKIAFIVPVAEQKVYDLNGEIIIEPDKIEIKSVSGMIKKGKFNLDGSINLSHNKVESSNINFHSVALPVGYQDYFEGILTSNLNYSGNLTRGRLKGDLLIIEGLYYQEFDPFGKVFKDKGTKILKSAANNDSLPEISLNLTLKSRHSIVIDNSSAFIELNPDIEIKGTVSDPLITGRARMEKGGFIVFQKNTFSIIRGVLDFAPVYGMLPTVDVQSEATVSDFTVYLAISGNLANPRFSLSSIPQKSHADIMTILLLGKNVNEFLKGNETAVSGTKEKFLANWLYNTFQKDIAKKFGLDYIEFSVSDGFSADDTSGTGLTIGKKISDRLILKYSASNNESQFIQKGIVDYQFFENIIFSGFQSTDGKFGAEIKYKLEYR